MVSAFNTVVILSGGLVKDSVGRWRTTTFNDVGDAYGIIGDRLRLVAGHYLYQDNPKIKFILLGGRGQMAKVPGTPTIASVMKRELEELGVPAGKILMDAFPDTTYQSLLALKNIVARRKIKKVLLISNRYHLPRIKTMIKYDPELSAAFAAAKVTALSAEEILIAREPKLWQKPIAAVYCGVAMRERLALEKKGIEDFKNGKYQFKKYALA